MIHSGHSVPQSGDAVQCGVITYLILNCNMIPMDNGGKNLTCICSVHLSWCATSRLPFWVTRILATLGVIDTCPVK